MVCKVCFMAVAGVYYAELGMIVPLSAVVASGGNFGVVMMKGGAWRRRYKRDWMFCAFYFM